MTGARQYAGPSFNPDAARHLKVPSDKSFEAGDVVARANAEFGSRALLNAIHRYFLKGGRG